MYNNGHHPITNIGGRIWLFLMCCICRSGGWALQSHDCLMCQMCRLAMNMIVNFTKTLFMFDVGRDWGRITTDSSRKASKTNENCKTFLDHIFVYW